MNILFIILDYTFFVLFSITTLYLLFFALASIKRKDDPLPTDADPRRIAVLIPAYKEDAVIMDCVDSCLKQNYPRSMYEVVVIADGMREDTIASLECLPAQVIRISLEKSTKAKALNVALSQLSGFDIALVLDADNIIEPLFLQKMNAAFIDGNKVVQAHRIAKNQNTELAILDAVSEEINNSIFRKGHVNAGFSSALIGSGMAFEFSEFQQTMSEIYAVGGFDKELEHIYLKRKIKIAYLQNAIVWDEKIQRTADYSKQRRRWLSAQFNYLFRFLPLLPRQLLHGNWDFCDKLFQMTLFPRIIMLGGLVIFSLFWSLLGGIVGIKWWLLLMIFVLSLGLSVPRQLLSKRLGLAILSLPYVFILTLQALLKIRGANKEFIHTSHG